MKSYWVGPKLMTDIIGEGDLDTGTERIPCEDRNTQKNAMCLRRQRLE